MITKLRQIIDDIDKANQERRRWLYFSSIVFLVAIGYISAWFWIRDLANPYVEWSFISSGFIVTINWWFWTMSIIRKYIAHQKTVASVLNTVIEDLKSIKVEVENLNISVDKKDKIS